MPTLAGPASVPLLSGPAEVYVDAFAIPAQTPEPPAPDLTVDYDPAVPGPRVRVILGRAISREVIGCLETAEVSDWSEDVDVLAVQAGTAVASSWDPLWAAAGDLVGISADGRLVYDWDPKGYIVWFEYEGGAVWTGLFRAPIDIGDGQVAIAAVTPAAVFAERILGRGEQLDQLGNKGSFEYDSIEDMEADGWVIPGGVTASIITDGVSGGTCLQVTGDGWVESPKVTLAGAADYQRTIEVATFAKFNINIPAGAVCLAARAVRLYDGGEDTAFRYDSQGVRPDEKPGFTSEPITAGGRMLEGVDAHRCWAEIRSFAGVTTAYDLTTLRQGITTGAPPGSSQDLTWYVERVFRDLHTTSPEVGGSPTGLATRILNPCGTEAEGMRWAHNQRTPFRDVLTSILDRDGGPECRITPGWHFEITDRLGSDRNDIALGVHNVATATWATDPQAQIEDLIVDTGKGSGTSWLSVTKSQPENLLRHRVVAIITAPVDRTLNQLDPWAQAYADAAALVQRTSTVAVAWDVAAQITTGDTLWVTFHDGLQGMSQRMRVVTRRFRPSAMLVDCTLAPVDA